MNDREKCLIKKGERIKNKKRNSRLARTKRFTMPRKEKNGNIGL